MEVIVDVKGMKELLAKLGASAQEISDATDTATWQEGLAILGVSVKQVPVDAGHLRQSAYAIPPRGGEVEIGYGKKYALPVHDRTEAQHKVGKANYLKDPLSDAQAGYVDRIARRAAVNFKTKKKARSVRSNFPETTEE